MHVGNNYAEPHATVFKDVDLNNVHSLLVSTVWPVLFLHARVREGLALSSDFQDSWKWLSCGRVPGQQSSENFERYVL